MDKGNHQKGNGQQLPPVGVGVFVEQNGEERFAYLDAAGLWRDYYNGDILNSEVKYKPDSFRGRWNEAGHGSGTRHPSS